MSRLVEGYFKGRRDPELGGYCGDIRYRYTVGNGQYEGNRLSFNRSHCAAREGWRPTLELYPVGKNVDVFYDPKNPGFAVLDPGLIGEMAFLYEMDIAFIAGSGLALLVMISKSRQQNLP